MSIFWVIIIFLIVLSILVFAHEFGHFWVARKLGVKAEEFGFGFPPRVAGVYKDTEGKWKTVKGNKEVKDAADTVFSVNWIPLGGFVRIKGEDGTGEEDRDSFANKKIWKRASILSAGVAMNVILAMVLFALGFMIGMPQAVDGAGSRATIENRHVQVSTVLPDSPAQEADLKPGDIVTGINGREFESAGELDDFIKDKQGQELNYKIKRGDEVMTKQITPLQLEETGDVGIGIGIVTTGLVKYPWYLAIWEGIRTALWLLWAIIVALFGLLKGLIMGESVGAEVGGPVRIASMTGQYAEMGFVYLLQFTSLLSINLAIINFLPLPALDGGRVIFLIVEKIKGSPVRKEVEAAIHNIGFLLLILLILLITFNDVIHLIGG